MLEPVASVKLRKKEEISASDVSPIRMTAKTVDVDGEREGDGDHGIG